MRRLPRNGVPPSGPKRPGTRRNVWLYAFGTCGAFLVIGRALHLAGGPQLLISIFAALAFGAGAAYVLRLINRKASVAAQLTVGAVVTVASFAGWYFLYR